MTPDPTVEQMLAALERLPPAELVRFAVGVAKRVRLVVGRPPAHPKLRLVKSS